MNSETINNNGQCQCGDTQFSLLAAPIMRILCHCTICQEFNDAPFADITAFSSKHVQLANKESIDFKMYKKPPAVQRGKCKSCNKPAIELFDAPLFPSLTIIPSANLPTGQFLPEQADMHIFYHSRIADIDDELPKYSGFLKSQFAFMGKLISSSFNKK